MRRIARWFFWILEHCTFQVTASLHLPGKLPAPPLRLTLWSTTFSKDDRMGCCNSKTFEEVQDPLEGTGICEKQVYPIHLSPTGLQVLLAT